MLWNVVRDPSDVDWKKAEAFYHRIWCTVWKGTGVGLVRDKAMAIVICEAKLGIRGYIEFFNLNRQPTPDHGWVFYLLKSHLEDPLKKIDQDLFNEAN